MDFFLTCKSLLEKTKPWFDFIEFDPILKVTGKLSLQNMS